MSASVKHLQHVQFAEYLRQFKLNSKIVPRDTMSQALNQDNKNLKTFLLQVNQVKGLQLPKEITE